MKVGKIKKITMYRVDFDSVTPEEQKTITDYGRSVITEDQYFEIGAVKALENFTAASKKKKRTKRIN
jgi:hypothetical protein